MPDFTLTQILILVVLALLFIFPARGLEWLRRREWMERREEAPSATVQIAPVADIARRSRFCTECGAVVDGSRRFCTECGMAIVRA